MAKTNAERQKAYRNKIKEALKKARQGQNEEIEKTKTILRKKDTITSNT